MRGHGGRHGRAIISAIASIGTIACAGDEIFAPIIVIPVATSVEALCKGTIAVRIAERKIARTSAIARGGWCRIRRLGWSLRWPLGGRCAWRRGRQAAGRGSGRSGRIKCDSSACHRIVICATFKSFTAVADVCRAHNELIVASIWNTESARCIAAMVTVVARVPCWHVRRFGCRLLRWHCTRCFRRRYRGCGCR